MQANAVSILNKFPLSQNRLIIYLYNLKNVETAVNVCSLKLMGFKSAKHLCPFVTTCRQLFQLIPKSLPSQLCCCRPVFATCLCSLKNRRHKGQSEHQIFQLSLLFFCLNCFSLYRFESLEMLMK